VFLISNTILHYLNPLACMVYWIIFLKKNNCKWVYSLLWLIYPLIYLLLIFIKGVLTGKYTYQFLNVPQFGYPRVLFTCLVLIITFFITGMLMIMVNKVIGKIKSSQS
jgi:hypothetical protein